MGLKFSIPYQIPFYETDITHQVKLPHLLAFSLQVSGMQSESLGNTDKEVFDKYGLVWIVTDYAIEIDRLPRYNEKVTITTEPFPIIRFFVTVIFTSRMRLVNKSCSLRLLLLLWIMKRVR